MPVTRSSIPTSRRAPVSDRYALLAVVMSRRLLPLLAAAMAIGCMCDGNPYAPETGAPVTGTPRRSSPTGVVDQLLSAYENKSLGLFTDLFAEDNSFRFYVSPKLIEAGTSVNTISEQIDSTYEYIPEGTYHYWTYDSEKRSHERLFDQAVSITVAVRPVYEEEDFVYHLSAGGDTVGVEVLMVGGELIVRVPIDATTNHDYPVAIERQVFYLTRDDSNDRWVIRKWFDFGTSG